MSEYVHSLQLVTRFDASCRGREKEYSGGREQSFQGILTERRWYGPARMARRTVHRGKDMCGDANCSSDLRASRQLVLFERARPERSTFANGMESPHRQQWFGQPERIPVVQ